MKKFISAVIAIVFVMTSGIMAFAADKGDVNKDGKITSADALAILQYAVGTKYTIDKTLADLNGDGKVNSADALSVLKIVVGIDKVPSSKTWVWPLPYSGTYISSNFGYRSDPFTGATKYHSGTDITMEGARGKNIVASRAGTVSYVQTTDNGGYGIYLRIDHGDGFETLYAHCSELKVSQGQRVSQGQVIALVGSTGAATGPHVHFEVFKNGERVDPLDYVSIK